MKTQALKGMRDLLPADTLRDEFVGRLDTKIQEILK